MYPAFVDAGLENIHSGLEMTCRWLQIRPCGQAFPIASKIHRHVHQSCQCYGSDDVPLSPPHPPLSPHSYGSQPHGHRQVLWGYTWPSWMPDLRASTVA